MKTALAMNTRTLFGCMLTMMAMMCRAAADAEGINVTHDAGGGPAEFCGITTARQLERSGETA